MEKYDYSYIDYLCINCTPYFSDLPITFFYTLTCNGRYSTQSGIYNMNIFDEEKYMRTEILINGICLSYYNSHIYKLLTMTELSKSYKHYENKYLPTHSTTLSYLYITYFSKYCDTIDILRNLSLCFDDYDRINRCIGNVDKTVKTNNVFEMIIVLLEVFTRTNFECISCYTIVLNLYRLSFLHTCTKRRLNLIWNILKEQRIITVDEMNYIIDVIKDPELDSDKLELKTNALELQVTKLVKELEQQKSKNEEKEQQIINLEKKLQNMEDKYSEIFNTLSIKEIIKY